MGMRMLKCRRVEKKEWIWKWNSIEQLIVSKWKTRNVIRMEETKGAAAGIVVAAFWLLRNALSGSLDGLWNSIFNFAVRAR